MMDLKHIVIAIVVGYLFGNIPSGYLYAKAHGVNIFKVGSGNPGTTNISRTFGKKAGATVLLMDMAKAIIPILFLNMLWKPATFDESALITLLTGAGAVLGHDFPFIPKLKGGKGIATSWGLIMAFDWKLGIVLILIFILVVIVTGYVSVGSITASAMFFILTALFGRMGLLRFSSEIYPLVCGITFVMSALAIWQHRSNIDRLMKGTESKFHFKK